MDQAHADPAPFVSVVIPTHRRPALLRAVLDSLDRQTFPADRMEVIVVGSPDDPGFRVISDRPPSRFPIHCTSIPADPSGGRSAAAKRNYGARIARGAWLAFIDDDCVADPGWLEAAARHFESAVALEGAKVIPPMNPPTLTYKGLRQFEQPGGFQSCNMFFRRDLFLEVGGFDPRYPFYLEDSDLAWTVLDAGHEIPHVADARVLHPAVPPQPWRLLDDSRRASLLRLLELKHPDRAAGSGMRILRGWHRAFLAIYLAAGVAVAFRAWWAVAVAAALAAGLAVAVAARWFRGCRFGWHELLVTTALIPAVPVVRAACYLRGCLKYRRPIPPSLPLTPGRDGVPA